MFQDKRFWAYESHWIFRFGGYNLIEIRPKKLSANKLNRNNKLMGFASEISIVFSPIVKIPVNK